jgi:hypothetical protein
MSAVTARDINITVPERFSDQATRRDLSILLQRVRLFWVEGVLERSLHCDILLELGKEFEPAAIHNPWQTILEVPGQKNQIVSENRSVLDVFDEVGGSIVILGEPGAGKTTSLLSLARGLIRRREASDAEPVPVVLNLATWANRYSYFADWVVDELKEKYQIPAPTGRTWLREKRLTLLLDGLDETDDADRASCIAAINEFSNTVGVPGLVVCSRVQEYYDAGVQLHAHAALRVLPLSRQQVDSYLEEQGPALAAIRKAVADNPEWFALARVPLMLSVLTVVGSRADSAAIARMQSAKPEDLRDEVFKEYVDAMLSRKGVRPNAPPRSGFVQWMSTLAQSMQDHSHSLFLLEDLQPSWLASRRWQYVYLVMTRVMASAAVAIGSILFLTFLSGDSDLADVLTMIALLAFTVTGRDWLHMHSNVRTSKHWNRVVEAWHGIPFLAVTFGVIATLQSALFDPSSRELGDVIGGLGSSLYGAVLALLVPVKTADRVFRNDISTTESIRWSWKGALRGAIGAGAAAYVLLVLTCASYDATDLGAVGRGILDRENHAFPAIMAGIFSVFGGILGAMRRGVRAESIRPNQGIRVSVRYSLATFALIVVLETPIIALVDDDPFRSAIGQAFMSASGLALIAGLWIGGFDAMKHYLLRGLLWTKRTLPAQLVPVLEYGCDTVLLRRVGAGYVFIHRLLLEYFAQSARLLPR